ncbi:MAG: hypothetical protein ABIH53_00065, partial [archaeon]
EGTSICQLFYKYSGIYAFVLIIGVLFIAAAVIFGVAGFFQLLGVNVFTSPQGWTFTLLGTFLLALILYFKLRGM